MLWPCFKAKTLKIARASSSGSDRALRRLCALRHTYALVHDRSKSLRHSVELNNDRGSWNSGAGLRVGTDDRQRNKDVVSMEFFVRENYSLIDPHTKIHGSDDGFPDRDHHMQRLRVPGMAHTEDGPRIVQVTGYRILSDETT